MKAILKQCIECPAGVLRPLWKSNPPLCKTHAHYRSAKKQIAEKKVVDSKADKDERFYKFVWANKNHVCEECGKQLTDMKRWYMHHILPKAKFPYFRFDSRNIIILCYTHHNEIESAVSAPKMTVYSQCEELKRKLLSEAGIEYSPKTG